MSRSATLSAPAPYVPKTRKWALVLVLLAAFVGAAIVAAPLWIAIVLGSIMAVSAYRPYLAFSTKLGGRAGLAAGIVTLTSGLLLAVAGSAALVALTNELMKFVTHLDMHVTLASLVGSRASRVLELLGFEPERFYAWAQRELGAAASFAASAAAIVVRTTSEAVLGFVVALMTMYYMLLEGPELSRRLERISPLEPRHTRALFVEAREVAHSAFVGTLATAAVQGFLAGIGYAMLGVPEPVTWAVVTALASFLPVIGTLVVWVPISGYLLLDGHPIRAIVMVAWGIVVVTSFPDYVLRPRFVGARGRGHPLLTLIALLGGIEVFGLAGLLIAPIVMSVFVAAFRIYEREVSEDGVLGTSS